MAEAPDAPQSRPEEPVHGIQPRPWPFAVEHGELLAQGEDFQGGVTPTAEEDADCRQEGKEEFGRELHLVT